VLRVIPRARLLAAALATAAVASLAACGASSASGSATPAAATPGVVDVVAAEDPWGDVARQIGGDHASVTSIMKDPSADPHSYEVDPRAAAAMSSARLVVVNGAGYDDFATKLLRASPSDTRTVVEVADVAGATGDGVNPHLWYDPDAVRRTADALTRALSRIEPAHAAEFTANEEAFLASYQPYVDTLAAIRAAHAGARVGYTERVPGYLVQAAGLRLGTPAGFARAVEDGDDPSPADTARSDQAITSRSIRALLYNRQVVSAQTRSLTALATRSGVPVVPVTETLPPGEDFQTWQLHQAEALAAALERSGG
jgi:zinc/manganese transport system substrate-binding protein